MLIKPLRKKEGGALISALFIMTIIAIAATAMSTRLQLDIYRTRLTVSSDKLYLASQAITFWAMGTLADEKKHFTHQNKKGEILSFPIKWQQMYPNVTLTGGIYDLQARFNINDLLNNKFHPLFFKLLEKTLSKQTDSQRKALLGAIYYWISPYQPERGHDEFLNYYAKQRPPYLPAYQPMQSISELRLVRGVSSDIYNILQPYLTALPEVTAVNINTAPKTLLMSLGNGLTASQAGEIIEARGEEGITDLKDVTQLLQKFDIPNEQITIDSKYYLCIATAQSPDIDLTIYTVLKRQKEGPKGRMTVGIVSQSINTP